MTNDERCRGPTLSLSLGRRRVEEAERESLGLEIEMCVVGRCVMS